MKQFSIFCTGSSGLVASAFKKLCQEKGIDFVGLDLHDEQEKVDILDPENLKIAINSKLKNSNKPILFHFAAFTATGKNLSAEQVELSKKLNIDGTKNVLQICQKLNIPMVHISTDFVFAGSKKDTPFLVNDKLEPDDSIYSQTKAEAEKVVKDEAMIIRLAFPYGNLSHFKKGLLRKMLTWMEENQEINLYNDQKTCPTPISYFALACFKTAKLISQNKIKLGQILHIVGEPTTPFEFGNLIKEVWQKEVKIKPTQIGETGPRNLVLDTRETEQILGLKTPNHREELNKLYLNF